MFHRSLVGMRVGGCEKARGEDERGEIAAEDKGEVAGGLDDGCSEVCRRPERRNEIQSTGR